MCVSNLITVWKKLCGSNFKVKGSRNNLAAHTFKISNTLIFDHFNECLHDFKLLLLSSFIIDLSLGSFRKGKDKIHHGNHNNLHDVTSTINPFHFYTNPKWYESYFDPIIPRNVSFLMTKIIKCFSDNDRLLNELSAPNA